MGMEKMQCREMSSQQDSGCPENFLQQINLPGGWLACVANVSVGFQSKTRNSEEFQGCA